MSTKTSHRRIARKAVNMIQMWQVCTYDELILATSVPISRKDRHIELRARLGH